VEILFTPWRFAYVSGSADRSECIFCKMLEAGEDRANLVLLRAELNFVVLNRYPYTSGHLMIAPYRHIADPSDASPEELLEMMTLCTAATGILREHFKPEGFNIGMNIGRVAGAGEESHYHMHVVPRWGGDNSFVSVLGDARIVPENLADTYERLEGDFRQCRPG